jgi:hypothetical protein
MEWLTVQFEKEGLFAAASDCFSSYVCCCRMMNWETWNELIDIRLDPKLNGKS